MGRIVEHITVQLTPKVSKQRHRTVGSHHWDAVFLTEVILPNRIAAPRIQIDLLGRLPGHPALQCGGEDLFCWRTEVRRRQYQKGVQVRTMRIDTWRLGWNGGLGQPGDKKNGEEKLLAERRPGSHGHQ